MIAFRSSPPHLGAFATPAIRRAVARFQPEAPARVLLRAADEEIQSADYTDFRRLRNATKTCTRKRELPSDTEVPLVPICENLRNLRMIVFPSSSPRLFGDSLVSRLILEASAA
jgi:hypothetical protein